jgi:hypothetical protein
VNFDRTFQEAIANAFYVFVIATMPVACFEVLDRFDPLETSDASFEVVGLRWAHGASPTSMTRAKHPEDRALGGKLEVAR